jgi:hypothetical protein
MALSIQQRDQRFGFLLTLPGLATKKTERKKESRIKNETKIKLKKKMTKNKK